MAICGFDWKPQKLKELDEDRGKRKYFLNNLDYNNLEKLKIVLNYFPVNVNKICDSFIHNAEVMDLLIEQKPDHIKLLKRNINGFKELAIKSVSKKGILLNDIYKIVEELDKESQREIILEAAKNDGWVMKYPLSGSHWLKDMEIVYACVKHKYLSKRCVHPLKGEDEELLNNYDLMKTALLYDDNVFTIMNDELKSKKDILLYALDKDDAYMYELCPNQCLDEDFIQFLIDNKLMNCLYRLYQQYDEIMKRIKKEENIDFYEILTENNIQLNIKPLIRS